ncbi:MAG: type II toxin-antitoxin system RelB/DinJ family antitoxin [Defluviitaleaceae bacterium]|nr:type II toxin-antitoxin system RelB/DinJ family antitoxin [Defluviitaleaceae bacterium]
MSTTRISVNVDGEVKQNAQRILGEIGMDLTTVIDLLLRTIVREERIPLNLQTEKSYQEEVYRQYIRAELEKSKIEAADPNTRLFSHDEVMSSLKMQREARI